MNENVFKCCPSCGQKNIKYVANRKWVCSDCGFDLYNNVASAVGVILADGESNILFEVRAKEPRKGYLALPGGFVDQDETAEQAAIRECYEEAGLKVDSVEYLCSNPNDYTYKGISYKTCDLFFTAKIPDSCKEKSIPELINSLKMQQSEVSDFKACSVSSLDELNSLPLAFESARKTLTFWLNNRKI